MKFLFDTDHISIVQREPSARKRKIFDRLADIDELDVAFSVVSFHEQFLGAHSFLNRAADSKSLVRGYAMVDTILETFAHAQVLRFDEAAVELDKDLTARKIRIGSMDLRVAAIARSNDLTLVTTNTRDFEQVPDLRIEDWTK